jgi:hypothetical protein
MNLLIEFTVCVITIAATIAVIKMFIEWLA